MNSAQFKRLCRVVGLGDWLDGEDFVEVQIGDLRALIDDKLAAYERIKHLENLLAEAYEAGFIDGQHNPNGYSDKAERDACIKGLLGGN